MRVPTFPLKFCTIRVFELQALCKGVPSLVDAAFTFLLEMPLKVAKAEVKKYL